MSTAEISTTTPVAAKAHQCLGCGEEIPKGEKHFKYTGIFDDRLFSSRFHDACWTIANEADSGWLDGEGVTEGFLAEAGLLPGQE